MDVNCLRAFFWVTLASLSSLSYAQAENENETANDPEAETEIPGEGGIFGLGWLDTSQAFASDSVNTLANQLDRFFGVPSSDMEAAYSSLRLTLINSWDKIDGFEADIRVRGKVFLPRISERVSLVFSKDDGDDDLYNTEDGIGAETDQDESTKIDLGYNIDDGENQRVDFRVGLSSSLKARLSMRYRYDLPVSESFNNRISQTVYFKDTKGFGSLTEFQMDINVGETSLLRWSNGLRFEENIKGASWHSGISYFRKQSENTGITYFYRINGETKPNFLSRNDIGIRIRKNVARPWLFIEVEPGYTWQKESVHVPTESSPFIFLRFEMAIGR